MTEFIGIRSVLLDIETSALERLKSIREFDTADDPAILVCWP